MNLLKSKLKTQSSFQSGTNKKEELTSFDEVVTSCVHKSKAHSSNLKKQLQSMGPKVLTKESFQS